MTQLSIFDAQPQPPRRRHHVQATSVWAAMEEKSRLDKRVRLAVARLMVFVKLNDGRAPTSLELARRVGVDVLTTRIGLSDAKRQGLVEHAGKRRCSVSGKVSLTWRVKQR